MGNRLGWTILLVLLVLPLLAGEEKPADCKTLAAGRNRTAPAARAHAAGGRYRRRHRPGLGFSP